MEIEIQKVLVKDRERLERLMQLYLHDLSLYFPITFNSERCKYEYDLDPYFNSNDAYFIKTGNDILGFILVDKHMNDCFEISEIFVLNNYKRKKIGERAVRKVFDTYRGNWIIKAVPMSLIAEEFWKKVVNDYTKGNFRIEHTGKYKRAELYFSNYQEEA